MASRGFRDWLGELVFAHRKLVIVLFVVATLFMAYSARNLHIDAGFSKLLPLDEANSTLIDFLSNKGICGLENPKSSRKEPGQVLEKSSLQLQADSIQSKRFLAGSTFLVNRAFRTGNTCLKYPFN